MRLVLHDAHSGHDNPERLWRLPVVCPGCDAIGRNRRGNVPWKYNTTESYKMFYD
ncbi:hypothetical protein [Candidatus Methylacidithermus pantelleriae]|uniref:hypothetical protein n=1 Tax=Candidatus Methylacidithermus pantelleriae TaxID=2744239 RepID=UPI001BD2368A|nr:hypothetical protein [Candidatus Methylacidithermus pantelleriae]